MKKSILTIPTIGAGQPTAPRLAKPPAPFSGLRRTVPPAPTSSTPTTAWRHGWYKVAPPSYKVVKIRHLTMIKNA